MAECKCSLYSLCKAPGQPTTKPVLVEPRHLSYLLLDDTWRYNMRLLREKLEESTVEIERECGRLVQSVMTFILRCHNVTVERLKEVCTTNQSLQISSEDKAYITNCVTREGILQCYLKTIRWYKSKDLKKFLTLVLLRSRCEDNNAVDDAEVMKKVKGFKRHVNNFIKDHTIRRLSDGQTYIGCVMVDSIWCSIPAEEIERLYQRVRSALLKTTGVEHITYFCSVLYGTVLKVDPSQLQCREDCVQPCAPPPSNTLRQAQIITSSMQVTEPCQPPFRVYLPSGSEQVVIPPLDLPHHDNNASGNDEQDSDPPPPATPPPEQC